MSGLQVNDNITDHTPVATSDTASYVYLTVLVNISRLLSELTGAPYVLICLKTPTGQRICGSYGLNIADVPKYFLYNLYTLHSERIFEVPDTTSDIRFAQNVLVTGEHAVKYYASISVFNDAGEETGAICIMSPAAHLLDARQRDDMVRAASITKAIWRAYTAQDEILAQKFLLEETSAYIILSPNLNIEFVSRPFFRITGFSTSDSIGEPFDKVCNCLNEAEKKELYSNIKIGATYVKTCESDSIYNGTTFTFLPYFNDNDTLQHVFLHAVNSPGELEARRDLQFTEELTGTGIWKLDVDTGITEWSTGLFHLLEFGQDDKKLPNETPFDYILPEDSYLLQQLPMPIGFVQLHREGKQAAPNDDNSEQQPANQKDIHTLTVRIKTRKSTILPITCTWRCEFDRIGNAITIKCVCRAASTDAETSLPSNPGYCILNEQGEILHANHTLIQMLGYETEWPTGIKLSELAMNGWQQGITSVIQEIVSNGNGIMEQLISVKKKDGDPLYVHASLQHIPGNEKKPATITCALTNVTSLKQAEIIARDSERMYRNLIEESPHMMFITDQAGRFIYANNRVRKLTGKELAELNGQSFIGMYDDEWKKKVAAFYQKQLQDNTEETCCIFPIKLKDGTSIWTEQIATLIKEGTKVTGFRFATFDITERLKTQQAMEEAARLATEAKEMQQTFLGKMSHEIRTPMNGVVGMVNLLNTTTLTEEQQEFVDGIKESSVNLIRIINDILDVTKIQSGKLVFEETEFVLKNLINSVIFTLKTVADQKGIQLLSQIDSQIPDRLIADPVRLNQILLNLVDNALKFTEKGYVSITVLHKERIGDRLVLELIIADTGIGIPQNKIDTIFDSFTQAQSDNTRKYGGTGLGLTIAKQLIEQQGGTIKVTSKVDKGTTFSFTFNFRLNGSSADTHVIQNTAIIDLSGCKLLLVEDNVMNQRVAKYTIEKWGATVAIAESGYKAMEMLREESFDLILMDIQMPDMNGLETTARLRKEMKISTPIMAMTASAMQGERENCMRSGMNDYISKPFNPAELNRKIADLMPARQQDTDKKVTNVDYLRNALNGNDKELKEIMELYLTKAPQQLEAIERNLNAGFYENLKTHVHTLKDTVGALGADHLFHLIDTIEFSLKGEKPAADIMAMIGQMRTLVRQSVEEIKEELKNI